MFVGKLNSPLQEFHYASPDIVMKLVHTYATSMYGSNIWDIFSSDCDKIYKSYNVAVRSIFNLDRRTHRYLIEPISNHHHLKTLLAARYCTFHLSLCNSSKMPVRFLARLYQNDFRTVLGRTMATLAESCDVQDIALLKPSLIKRNMKYMPISEADTWRPSITHELLANSTED